MYISHQHRYEWKGLWCSSTGENFKLGQVSTSFFLTCKPWRWCSHSCSVRITWSHVTSHHMWWSMGRGRSLDGESPCHTHFGAAGWYTICRTFDRYCRNKRKKDVKSVLVLTITISTMFITINICYFLPCFHHFFCAPGKDISPLYAHGKDFQLILTY